MSGDSTPGYKNEDKKEQPSGLVGGTKPALIRGGKRVNWVDEDENKDKLEDATNEESLVPVAAFSPFIYYSVSPVTRNESQYDGTCKRCKQKKVRRE